MEKNYISSKTTPEIALSDDFYMIYEMLRDILNELRRMK